MKTITTSATVVNPFAVTRGRGTPFVVTGGPVHAVRRDRRPAS
jgi:hypothetical protein